jgi:hypothetical protein
MNGSDSGSLLKYNATHTIGLSFTNLMPGSESKAICTWAAGALL